MLCLLGHICEARQSSGSTDNIATPPSLLWNNANSYSSSPPPLKLDPVLRRALLRALTQLEVEAQRKALGETTPSFDQASIDSQPVDEEQEKNIKRDLEELLGNYENSYNENDEDTKIQSEPTQEPEIHQEEEDDDDNESRHEDVDMVIVDEPSRDHAAVTVFDYQAPDDEKITEPESQKPDESSSFVDKPEADAIFYRNEKEPDVKLEGTRQSDLETQPIDIRTNIIPSNQQEVNERSRKREDELVSNPLATSPSPDNKNDDKNNPVSDNKSSATTAAGSSKVDVDDVSIFQAPLVAAFTLEQDEKGNPKSVVPLIRRPQPVIQQQQQRLQQTAIQQQQQQQSFQQQSSLGFNQQQAPVSPFQIPAQQHRFQPVQPQLTREQELERKTRLLEQQVLQLQQLQLQQQQLQQHQQLKQQQILEQEQQRLRQQRLFEEEQKLRSVVSILIFGCCFDFLIGGLVV